MVCLCSINVDNIGLTFLLAKPDFITTSSKTSALLEAARTKRFTILDRLIEAGTKVNIQDSDGRSPLLLASECGDLNSVKALLNARVRPNDGSLHAAARGAYEEIVKLLLDNGHTANHINAGRSAVAELCLNGQSDGSSDWADKVYWVIHTLIQNGTNLDTEYGGKNLLHLALDNDMPVPIVTTLLQFPYFSEHLNSTSMMYEDPTSTVYSPISYAEVFYSGPQSEKTRLIALLKDKNCAPNLWNRQGNHPANYTYKTMPAHLKLLVDEDKLADQRHAKDLARRKDAARVEQELVSRQHMSLLAQESERSRIRIAESQQREAMEAASRQRQIELEIRQKHELAAAEAIAMRERHQLELNQQSAFATQRQQIEDRDRNKQFVHSQAMSALEEQKQKALTWESDRANEKQHTRQLQLLEKQDQSVRMRAQQMQEVAAAARNANAGIAAPGQQRMLDWATVD